MAVDITPWLEKFGITFNPNRQGNQPIKCPNPGHDDSHPSASLNLGKQLWNCLACGAGGSAVDLIMTVEGVPVREALVRAEVGAGESGGQVPREPGRSPLGLPRKPGNHRGHGSPVQTWRGFG